MSELIDRKALLDECLNHYEVGNIEQNCTMDWICKTVRNAPTIDAVPVVRCKECKYRRIDGFCVLFQQNINGIATKWFMPEDDWFCADGKKKVHDGQ